MSVLWPPQDVATVYHVAAALERIISNHCVELYVTAVHIYQHTLEVAGKTNLATISPLEWQ